MKKYLITGFSGFVGYHFISYLNTIVSEKTEVFGLDIVEPYDFRDWNFDKLSIIFKTINMLDVQAVNEVISQYKPDYILHLAALSSVGKSWEDPASCFKNNTEIFLNIVESIRKEKLKTKLLCIGSSEEYGYVDESRIPIREDMCINPSNPYAVTKVAQENLTKCYVDKFGLNITLTRSFNHIGPRQSDIFVIASFVKQVAQAYVDKKKELLMITGNLNVVRDFLDVRDVVSAYYMILQSGKAGELYNVCSGNGYALNDIVKLLSKISGIEIKTKINPDLIRPNDMPIIIGDNQKLKQDTNWKSKYNIEQSLIDIYNYWIDQINNK